MHGLAETAAAVAVALGVGLLPACASGAAPAPAAPPSAVAEPAGGWCAMVREPTVVLAAARVAARYVRQGQLNLVAVQNSTTCGQMAAVYREQWARRRGGATQPVRAMVTFMTPDGQIRLVADPEERDPRSGQRPGLLIMYLRTTRMEWFAW